MHAKPDLRVALKWMIAGSGSVITDVIWLMKVLREILRLVTIAVVSPCIGFGTLLFLDASRIVTPGNVDKGAFILFGFAVAIGVGLLLFKIWPSEYATIKQPNEQEDS